MNLNVAKKQLARLGIVGQLAKLKPHALPAENQENSRAFPRTSRSGTSILAPFFHLGRLIEEGPTADIFSNPREKQTEDYITGKIG